MQSDACTSGLVAAAELRGRYCALHVWNNSMCSSIVHKLQCVKDAREHERQRHQAKEHRRCHKGQAAEFA